MACTRRTLTSSFTHLSRRFHPSFAHILHDDRDGGEAPCRPPAPPAVPSPPRAPFVSQSIPNFTSVLRGGRRLGLSLSLGQDPFHPRFYSSGFEGGSNEIEIIKGVAKVLTDTAIDTAAATVSAVPAPFPGEVAAAAADSFLPVAALQYLIDGVHSFSGLNWWASIAMTTILIKAATIPLLLNPMRATVKINVMMRPELEELKQQMQNSMDLKEGLKRMKALFQKHGVSPFARSKRFVIQGSVFISFSLAISNMVEKVPSFKGGGAFWFTDLTTPDPLYMLPVLTSLTFLATVELEIQDRLDGIFMANNPGKNFPRVIALMITPFTAHFSKAILCYWITSNIFSLACRFVIKHPPVRKFLDLPDIVPQPTKPAAQPNFSFFGGSKPIEPTTPSSLEESKQLKPPERRVSSSSVISQRIRNLEKTIRNLEKTMKARSKCK